MKKNTDTAVLESSQTTWKLRLSKTTERRQTGGMSEAGDRAKREQVVQSYTADMAEMQEPLAFMSQKPPEVEREQRFGSVSI